MSLRNPKKGDPVVYTKSKRSVSPGPRARQVNPTRQGNSYSYVVDKFWSIKDVNPDGTVILLTRRGKTHLVRIDDPCLRRASLWERYFHATRFPTASESVDDQPEM